MASAPRERLLQLYKLGTQVFNTTFNPTNLRTGNKVLRQRLRGPALLDYYLKRGPTIKDMKKMWPEMRFVDEDEEQRVQAVEKTKSRGKGAPKKVRVKPDKFKKK